MQTNIRIELNVSINVQMNNNVVHKNRAEVASLHVYVF